MHVLLGECKRDTKTETGTLIYTTSERPVVVEAILLPRLLQSHATVRSALVFSTNLLK